MSIIWVYGNRGITDMISARYIYGSWMMFGIIYQRYKTEVPAKQSHRFLL